MFLGSIFKQSQSIELQVLCFCISLVGILLQTLETHVNIINLLFDMQIQNAIRNLRADALEDIIYSFQIVASKSAFNLEIQF